MGINVQTQSTLTVNTLVLGGVPNEIQTATILQDAGRGTTPLAYGTVMGRNPVTRIWQPWKSDLTTGALVNVGIFAGNRAVTGAELVAGDVTNMNIIVGDGIRVAESLLVLEKVGDTLDTAFGTAPNNTTLRDLFYRIGINPQKTISHAVGV